MAEPVIYAAESTTDQSSNTGNLGISSREPDYDNVAKNPENVQLEIKCSQCYKSAVPSRTPEPKPAFNTRNLKVESLFTG